jgi:hypothetical protein
MLYLNILVDFFTVAGMSSTVATLIFGAYTFRKKIIVENSRRIRQVLLETERIATTYDDIITETSYAPISHAIAMLICERSIHENDVRYANSLLNDNNERVKNHILVGIDQSGKYDQIKPELHKLQSNVRSIKEDLYIVSTLLDKTVILLNSTISAAISPQLFYKMLQKGRIDQFFNQVENIKNPKEFADNLAVYFDHGPGQFLEQGGKKVVQNCITMITLITRRWVDLDDNALHQEKNKQKDIARDIKFPEHPLEAMRICITLLAEKVSREELIQISATLARLEEIVGGKEN